MKTLMFLTVICVLCIPATAQAPLSFKYQAVARDASGNLLANKNVSFMITIRKGSTGGAKAYTETHTGKTTNAFGLVELEIGKGTVDLGAGFPDLSYVSWGTADYFITIYMDPAGGIAYQEMGTCQLLSVPYALYARDVQNKNDADADPANEIQKLSISGTTLTLDNGGGSVTLPSSGGGDNWGVQVVKTDYTLSGQGTDANVLRVNNEVLNPLWKNIKGMPAGFADDTDNVADGDTSSTNEIQQLIIEDFSLALTKGGGGVVLPRDNWGTQVVVTHPSLAGDGTEIYPLEVVSQEITPEWTKLQNVPEGFADGIDNVNYADTSSTNELQALTLSGTLLTLSKGGGTVTLPSSGGGDNWGTQVVKTNGTLTGQGTDASTLGVNQSALQPTWGNIKSVPAGFADGIDNVSDADTSVTNEIQTLALNGNNLSISGGNAVTLPVPPGDSWGTQTVLTDATLAGNGTAAAPLQIASQSATNGQVLKFNGTSWLPGADLTGAGATVPGGATGQIQFNNNGAFGGDAGFFWDNANKRFGIGTTTPQYSLSVITGNVRGVFGESSYSSGQACGVYGNVTAPSGVTYGLYGMSNSTNGYGVYGLATTTSQFGTGVAGNSRSPDGDGVSGMNTSTTGDAVGVRGVSSSGTGTGVYGYSNASAGVNYGVVGVSGSSSGTGIEGHNKNLSGTTYGVKGYVYSPDGFSGHFTGGKFLVNSLAQINNTLSMENHIISNVTNPVNPQDAATKAYVDASGGASGTPGGLNGQVQFNNNGAFGGDAGFFWDNANKRFGIGTTTPQYSLSVITGNVRGVFGESSYSSGQACGVYGNVTAPSGVTYGLYGMSNSTNGYGVYGLATTTSQFGTGVAGNSRSPDGDGVSGMNTSTTGDAVGVRGVSSSGTGTGVYGYSNASAGVNYGVVGVSGSSSGTGIEGHNKNLSGTTYGVKGYVYSPDGFSGHFTGGKFLVNSLAQINNTLSMENHIISNVTNPVNPQDAATKAYVDAHSGGGGAIPGGANRQIQFNDNGTFGGDSAFTWDKTNEYLGIGTSSPGSQLFINGRDNNIDLKMVNNQTGSGYWDGFKIALAAPAFGSTALIWHHEFAPIYFGTNNTLRMVLSPEGKVGIGTSSPVDLLHIGALSGKGIVIDELNWTDSARIMFREGGSDLYGGFLKYDASLDKFILGTLENGTMNNAVSIDRISGNVGINNLLPTSKLDIKGETNLNYNRIINVANPVNPQDAATKAYVDASGGGSAAPGGASGNVQFNNNGTLGGDAGLHWNKTTKRLGINDNTPDASLDVEGSAKFGANGLELWEIREITGYTNSSDYMTTVAYPAGYNYMNTRIMSLDVLENNNRWIGLGGRTDAEGNVWYTLTSSNIIISVPITGSCFGKLYRILVMAAKDTLN